MIQPTTRARARRCVSARVRAVGDGTDRGFSTLEAVVIIPVVVMLTMVVVQFAMLWHARNIAEAAAQDGLRVARGYQGTSAQGQASATQYLNDVAGPMLTHPQVTAQRGTRTVVITVHARVAAVIPFGRFSVTETAIGPVEEFAGTG